MTWSTLKQVFAVCYLLMCLTFFCIQERDQRRWNDSDFRCKEDKSSTAALQGHDGISGKIQIRVPCVIFPSLEMAVWRWVVFTQCETVAGADFPGHKQRRATGGQGEQPAAREVSRHLGQPLHSFYPLLWWTAMWLKETVWILEQTQSIKVWGHMLYQPVREAIGNNR